MSLTRRLDPSLREIRVLYFTGLDERDRVTCETSIISLNAKQEYMALSYAWGDPTVTRTILVDGAEFQATENLELALRHLMDIKTALWIDAICIRADVQEKQYCIPLMRHIYGLASRVTIWLGASDGFIDKYLPKLLELSNAQEPVHPRLYLLPFVLVGRPWFRRIWTVQECILASVSLDLRCGRHCITWTQFFDAVGVMMRAPSPADLPTLLQEVEHDTDTRESTAILESWPSNSFEECMHDLGFRPALRRSSVFEPQHLVIMLRRCSASLAHDYVYGFLGMLPDHFQARVPVDYSIPAMTVFKAFSLALLDYDNDLAMAVYGSLLFRGEAAVDSPSWVPDLSKQRSVVSETGDASAILDITGTVVLPTRRQVGVVLSHDEKKLMLPGVTLGSITWAEPIAAADGSEEIASRLSALLQNIWTRVGKVGDHHLRTLFGGTAYVRWSALDHPYKQHLDQVWRALFGGEDYQSFAAPSRAESLAGDLATAACAPRHRPAEILYVAIHDFVERTVRGKKMFGTDRRLLGIGPSSARVGDTLVYLDGMLSPFLLRPRSDHHLMIGAVRVMDLYTPVQIEAYWTANECPRATFRIG